MSATLTYRGPSGPAVAAPEWSAIATGLPASPSGRARVMRPTNHSGSRRGARMADGVGPAGVDPPRDRIAEVGLGDVVDIAAPRSVEFEDFVRAETAALLRSAYLLTGSSASAEDIVQETLTRLFPKWSRVQAAAYPKAYVHRTMVNTFLNSRRSKSSQEIVVDDIGDRPGPDDLAQRVTDADLVWGLLDRLGERQRAALVLRYFHDWTDQDIARAVGCRTGTVRSLISRGLSALRADLDSDRRDEGGR